MTETTPTPAGLPSTVPRFKPDAATVAAADALQAQAIKAVHHSERMRLVNKSLALRQGRQQIASTPTTTVATAAPIPSTPAVLAAIGEKPASTPMGALLGEYGVTPEDVSGAQSHLDALLGQGSGVTAVGLAQATHVGAKALTTLENAIADLSDSQANEYLARSRDSVARLYRSPEAQATASRDVAEAAQVLGLSGEVMDELAMLYSYHPRMHQQIQMVASQVLAAARKGRK